MNEHSIEADLSNNIEIQNIVQANKTISHENLTKKSENNWLLLFYMNGDNEQNDSIYEKLFNISKGIRYLRTEQNTPKVFFDTVTALVLWDGYNKKSSKTKHYHSETSLCEFVYPPNTEKKDFLEDSSQYLNNLSENIDWIANNDNELNLGSEETLEFFLSWSIKNYTASNIVLIFDGPSTGPFGSSDSRTATYDESSDYDYLTTDEISVALKNAGFSQTNKIDLIISNTEFSATIEDAYELKNYAKAYIAYPSGIPTAGLPYHRFLQSFTKDSTIQSIGINAVNIFASYYHKTNTIDSDHNIASISFIDLSFIDAVKNAIDPLASYIVDNSTQKKVDNGTYSYLECLRNNTYGFLNFDESSKTFITDYAMFYRCVYKYTDEADAYSWGHFFTFDLGYFCTAMLQTAQKNGDRSIQNNSSLLLKSLQKAIVASWRNNSSTQEPKGYYPSYIEENNADINYLGLTITGSSKATQNTSANTFYFQPYARKNLDFQTESNWFTLLKTAFPEQFE